MKPMNGIEDKELTPAELERLAREGDPQLTQDINEEHAEAAIRAYCDSVGYDYQRNEGVLGDILNSLRHWAVAHKIDHRKASAQAYEDYAAESAIMRLKERKLKRAQESKAVKNGK